MHTSYARTRTRVAMFVLNDVASDGRVRRSAGALDEAGYEVRVFARDSREHACGLVAEPGLTVHRLAVTPRPRSPASRDLQARSVAPRGARLVALRVYRPLVTALYWWRAWSAALTWSPDVVHAHDLNTLLPAAGVAARLRVPLVYDSHELWRHRLRDGQRRPVAAAVEALMERWLAPRADAVLTVSEGLASWLTASYRLRCAPRVLRNVPTMETVAEGTPALRTLIGSGHQRLVLYTGRIMPGRGLETLIAALPALPSDLSAVLLGYGDRPYVQALRRSAHAAGVGDRFTVVGPVRPSQVVAAAVGADLALVAIEPSCLSYRLSLPNKLFEAIHAGLPVVATDLPELGRLVRDTGVGVTFEPGDTPALIAAIETVLADPAGFRAASRRAAPRLCWEREREVLLDAYRDLTRPRASLLHAS